MVVKGTVAEDLRFEMKRFSMKNTMKMIRETSRVVKKVVKVNIVGSHWEFAVFLDSDANSEELG